MTFTNEWITPELIKKYDLQQDYDITTRPFKIINGQEVFLPFSRFVYSNLVFHGFEREITIDVERDMYLRYGGSGSPRAGNIGWTYYIFYFKGKRIYFALTSEKCEESDEDKKIDFYLRKLQAMYCQDEIKDEKPFIYYFIKEALDVYGKTGIFSNYAYYNQYDF